MRSHPATSTNIVVIFVAMFVALFARVPAADAQVRSLYLPGMSTIKAAPPEAGLTYAVIVVIPVAFTPITPITTIMFGRIAGAAPVANSYYAPAVLGVKSDRQEAGPFKLSGTGGPTMYVTGTCRPAQPVPGDCTSSGANVIVSAIIRF
jgi:hypothetical protein